MLIAVVFGLLIWERVRFDLVAFGALIVTVSRVSFSRRGISRFRHPAVVIIALVADRIAGAVVPWIG